jgi:hypothetical protein
MDISMVVSFNSTRDHIFNKASATIKVESTQEGVSVHKHSENIQQNILYGGFVKSGYGSDSCRTEQKQDKKDYSIRISDAELFQACEGRTARKGARGEQVGKLKRASSELLQNVNEIPITTEHSIVSDDVETALPKKRKKEKKSKKKSKKHKVSKK